MLSLVKLIKSTYTQAGKAQGTTVLHNVAFLSVLQVISYILPVVLLPYLFRVIGAERFGLICFAQSLIQYFLILTDYGFSVTATKDISIHRGNPAKISEIFSRVLTVKAIFALASIALLCVLMMVIPKFQEDWRVYLFGAGAIVGNVLFPVWFFQGMEEMKHIAKLNIIGEFIYAFFILGFVHHPEDYLIVPLTFSLVPIITGIVALVVAFNTFHLRFKLPTLNKVKAQLIDGWNMFISIVAINTYTTTRIFAVGLLTNNTVTGFYSIAEKLANVVQTFPLSSFTQAIFPRLSNIYSKDKTKARQLMEKVQSITIYIALLTMPLIWFGAAPLIKLVCGGDFPEVVKVFQLLLISVFFISANAFRVQFLLVSGKTNVYSKIHISMALVGLPLILLLISSYSYTGAALATIFIEGGIAFITYIAVKSPRAFVH